MKKRTYNRLYVGVRVDNGKRERFRSAVTPTQDTHGQTYIYAIGPFRTVAGAEFMRDYGANNPHCQCVSDAERLARLPKRKEMKWVNELTAKP
jgi:hypothetical protein